MHLGQTATYLASVLNRPDATVRMVSRLLREGGWIEKGPRGRNAPHITNVELANYLIALMSCPDSPAEAMNRLPHFANLKLEHEGEQHPTFSTGLAILLARLSRESWKEARQYNWKVSLALDMSIAAISTDIAPDSSKFEEHCFIAEFDAKGDGPAKDSMPYFGGLEVMTTIKCITLFRIAKVVLAGESDPLDQMVAAELDSGT